MASVLQKLEKDKLITPPKWIAANMQYETIMGSTAYGVSDDHSDIDIYGWCIPPKEDIFPHLRGEIIGFGRQKQRFTNYQQHHINDKESRKEYDLTIYSIVRYFDLCMECNPNMIDSLFTPRRCVLFSTQISEMVRDKRHLFLHKGAWHKFKGYAYSQIHKIGKANRSNPKRAASVENYGYDVKFAYHTVRLMAEVEQIMIEQDLDLERNREQLKAIRRGDWTLDYLKEWFEKKEHSLETVYANSTLQYKPDEEAIKQLLLTCLEHHYGSLDKAITTETSTAQLLQEMEAVLEKYR